MKVEEVINKILCSDKNNISLTLTKIVAVLDVELSQLKMNEEEEYVRKEKHESSQ